MLTTDCSEPRPPCRAPWSRPPPWCHGRFKIISGGWWVA